MNDDGVESDAESGVAHQNGADSFRCTYLLPIRRVRADGREAADFARYFERLARAGCEVLVVDGSPPEVFDAHDDAWRGACRHVRVNPKYAYLNGKVNGVHTGVDLARSERIVLADDDIRYTSGDIARACELLDRYEMLRPQNYLAPLPVWGRMEAARMLINRGVLRTGDYPGTCAFRRSTCLRVGHYDGDVLFDNEEIVRHFAVQGASVGYARDFFIHKRPSTLRKWMEQRPRQAYEDFVMRAKTALFMSLVPLALLLGALVSVRAALAFVAVVACGAMLLAARGLLTDGAYKFFPAHVLLYAPLWVLERALSVYWALYWRVARGGYPFGDRLLSKGTGRSWVAGGRAVRRELNGRTR
ncbi:MAG TPA: glycosyltransferase family 2 protein [Pyrinomonadaceae bacterium]|nr:glycosyltransferase family 2 protein [Pyrinomonadaceae bacterium]